MASRKPECSSGTLCGWSCISRGFACIAALSDRAMQLASGMVAMARATANGDKLYKHVDSQGKTWFVKKCTERSGQKEHDAYVAATRLGIQGMLVRPTFVQNSDIVVWPMLEGETLRDKLNRDGRKSLTESQLQQLAIAKQFDVVIRNPDRNAGNVWVMPDGRLKLIDHDSAFSSMYTGEVAHVSNMTLAEAQAIWRL